MSKNNTTELFNRYRSEPKGVALPITEIARVAVGTVVRVTLAIDRKLNEMSEVLRELIVAEPIRRKK